MPIVGERKKITFDRNYINDPMAGLAAKFKEAAQNILTESTTDIFSDPMRVFMNESANSTLRDFFVSNSADPSGMTADEYDTHINEMTEMYENDKQGILENCNLSTYNPVVGMNFPMHKNILMNCIFDKGAIPKAVAVSPKFTITMENRYLVKPDGTEIDLYRQQDLITDAIESTAPEVDVELKLPEIQTTNILDKIGASSIDNLSIECYISAVKVTVKTAFKKDEILPDGTKATADTTEVWYPVDYRFAPAYGEYDRTLTECVKIVDGHIDPDKNTDYINAFMKDNKFVINSVAGVVKAVKLRVRKDTSNAMLQCCSTRWNSRTIIQEIGSAIPINTTVSPEEVKDLGALYNQNQLTKIMSMMQLVLANYKDDKIRRELDKSWNVMPDTDKSFGVFDFAPREGYLGDHVEWRHATFMDMLDTHVTNMLQVLNDPNMVVTIFGRPDLIRKIAPTEYSYQTPSSIGEVELEFIRTVVTSDKRTYQFISSQKLKGSNELIMILCPRNTNRIIYRIYDYQMYISNEIRNAMNPSLPSIHAFQRWKFVSYQPVQGRLRILNPTGLREGKDIPTLGSLGTIGHQSNMIKDFTATTPKGSRA